MKRAAGVNEISEVVERFKTQGQTSEILEVQNEKAKVDVMKLSKVKEELQNTWEKVRYAGQSENTEINDRCNDLGLDIEFSEERKEKADLQIDVVGSIEKKS